MSPIPRDPETHQPMILGELDAAARGIADGYALPETPGEQDTVESDVPAVVLRARELEARVLDGAATFRDPYASQTRRAKGIIETRDGEDFGKEQGVNHPAVTIEVLAAARPSASRRKRTRTPTTGPVVGEEGQELDDWHPDVTAEQLSIFGIAKAREALPKK